LLCTLFGAAASYHHNQVEILQFYAVLAKNLPDDSLCPVSVYCTRQRFFADNYPEPGIISAIARKRYFEIPVRNAFSAHNVIETIVARQSISSSKLGRELRRQVLSAPWRGVH
jgi:hypothetical protein